MNHLTHLYMPPRAQVPTMHRLCLRSCRSVLARCVRCHSPHGGACPPICAQQLDEELGAACAAVSNIVWRRFGFTQGIY